MPDAARATEPQVPCDINQIRCHQITLSELVPHLKPGDIGLSRNSGLLGKAIRFGQRLEDCGEDAPFSHAFVITLPEQADGYYTDGSLVESVARIGFGHLSHYCGQPICIARHTCMDPNGYFAGMAVLQNNIGQLYPSPKLVLHAVDMIRCALWKRCGASDAPWRWSAMTLTDWPVCSELVAQFLLGAGLKVGTPGLPSWKGTAPDHLFDAIRWRPDLYQPIYWGELH